MRILKIALSTLLILFGIFLVGGFLIPDEWVASRSISIHASPEQIYPFVSHFEAWEKWSPWNSSKDATLKYTYEGSNVGVGAKQSWTSEKMGHGWMQFTSMNPQTGVAYDLYIDMGHSPSVLHGDIGFTPEGDETKITWTDRGHSGASYGKRWMNLMIQLMIGKDLDTGLAGLKNAVEKK